MGRQTDFILMGMPKCGTTTFFDVIKQHTRIDFPVTGKHAVYYKDMGGVKEFEKKLWSGSKRYKKHGFCAENWHGLRNAKEMYRDFNKDLKIIFILRNPVDRAYSEYKFAYEMEYASFDSEDISKFYKYPYSKSFDLFVKRHLNDNKMIFNNGKYYEIVEPFIRYFGKERVKVIIFEELIQNKEKIYNEILEFIGVKKENINYNMKSNEGKFIPQNMLSFYLYRFLYIQTIHPFTVKIREYLYSASGNWLYLKIRCLFRKVLCESKDDSKMLSGTYHNLKKYYYKDCEKLSKLLDKDLIKLWFAE